ncbi:MAG: YwiC-like family protein [Bryobacterales bacterium]|nr:YwiC-like family protein [Bryobacteraceae bacterium]MDW8354292.1 YwiC-like family protein [Bryobacterales bacterium]
MKRRFVWPREHGAWAMFLLPFFAGLVAAGDLRWEALPALVAVLGIFLMQEPLLVLLRQRYVWKERRESTADAAFSLTWLLPLWTVSVGILFWRLPWQPLVALGLLAAALAGLRAVFTLSNRQRFVLLQLLEAAGLSSTALLAYLCAGRGLPRAAWLLWGVFSLHHAAALFVIRARLEAITASRGRAAQRAFRITAWCGQAAVLGAAVLALVEGNPRLAAAFAVPFAFHTRDLLLLDHPAVLGTPLTRVGWREVAISLAFAALVASAMGAA